MKENSLRWDSLQHPRHKSKATARVSVKTSEICSVYTTELVWILYFYCLEIKAICQIWKQMTSICEQQLIFGFWVVAFCILVYMHQKKERKKKKDEVYLIHCLRLYLCAKFANHTVNKGKCLQRRWLQVAECSFAAAAHCSGVKSRSFCCQFSFAGGHIDFHIQQHKKWPFTLKLFYFLHLV